LRFQRKDYFLSPFSLSESQGPLRHAAENLAIRATPHGIAQTPHGVCRTEGVVMKPDATNCNVLLNRATSIRSDRLGQGQLASLLRRAKRSQTKPPFPRKSPFGDSKSAFFSQPHANCF
jgi:hypothetical protein